MPQKTLTKKKWINENGIPDVEVGKRNLVGDNLKVN